MLPKYAMAQRERIAAYVQTLNSDQAKRYAREYAENCFARTYAHPMTLGLLSPRAADILRAHVEQAIRGG